MFKNPFNSFSTFSIVIFLGIICMLTFDDCAKAPKPFAQERVEVLKKQVLEHSLNPAQTEWEVQDMLQSIKALDDSTAMIQAAKTLHTLGNTFIDSMHFLEARSVFQVVLAIRQQVIKDPKHVDILRALHNIGFCFVKAENDYLTAVNYYDRVDIPESKALMTLYVANNMRKGVALRKTGQLDKALRHFRIAFDTLVIYPEPVSVQKFLPDLLVGYSHCLLDLGSAEEALQVCRDGMKKIGQGKFDDNPEILVTLGSIWQVLFRQCTTADSRMVAFRNVDSFSLQALRIYQEQHEYLRAGIIAGNLSEMYRLFAPYGGTSYYFKAEDLLKTTIETNQREQVEKSNLAQLYINLGEVYMDQHLPDQALVQFRNALQSLFPENQPFPSQEFPPAYELKGEPIEKLPLLSEYAQVYLTRSSNTPEDLLKATALYECLFDYINHLRGELMTDESKLELAAKSQDWLQKAFNGNMRLYRENNPEALERAFQISEQGKAFALLEAARLRNASAQFPEIQQREHALLAEATAAQTEEAIEETDKRKREYFKFLKNEYPAYYNLKYQGANKTPAEIHAALDTNQALITYFCQDSLLYAFVLNGKNLFVDSFSISRSELTRHANAFQQLLAKESSKMDTSEEKKLSVEAFYFYQTIFRGLEKFDLPERLVIVPDGPLNGIPFEAFLMHAGTSDPVENAVGKNYLVFRYVFSYCFSAHMLCEMNRDVPPASLHNELAVFAPFDNEQNQRREVENIAALTKSTLFPREQSTKANFFSACRQYSSIHVATHGLMNTDPDSSYIIFTGSSDVVDTLFLKELYDQRLGQDLIAFSACETAIGSFRPGEGSMSLARGLAYAGVRSIITTLWKVPTDGKAIVIPEFYNKAFNEKMSRDWALTLAKRSFLGSKSRLRPPDNWAGLVLIGASQPADPVGSGWWKHALLALCVGVTGYFAWKYYRRKGRKSKG